MTTTPPLSIATAATLGPLVDTQSALQALEETVAETLTPAPPGAMPTAPSAVATAIQAAVSEQGGLAPLLADLAAALQTSDLPAPVAAAAARLLDLQLPIDPPPTAADLKQALAQSGLFLESRLAAPNAAQQPDLKAALLDLGQALETWVGAQMLVPQKPIAPRPAPPYRGGPVGAQRPATPGLTSDASADEVAGRLNGEVHGAIARVLLQQAASLPAEHAAGESHGPQWLFEVPLNTSQGGAVSQFEIGRDGKAEGGDGEPVWRARFSLDLEPMGTVHAKIALSGDRARVTLWAQNPETAQRLADQSGGLSDALLGDDLKASVSVFPGAPDTPAPSAGRFLDKAI